MQADERLPAGKKPFGQVGQIKCQRADRRSEVDMRSLPEADAIGAIEDEDEIPHRAAVGNDVDQRRQRHDQHREHRNRNYPPVDRRCSGRREIVTRFRHIEPSQCACDRYGRSEREQTRFRV